MLVGCRADEIWCLERTSLRKVWKSDSEDQALGSVLSVGFFGTFGARQTTVRSVDDGQKIWSLPGPWGFRGLGDGRVLCDRSGVIELREVATGAVLSTFQEEGFGYGWLPGHVQLYVRDNSLAAVDVERGTEVWRRARWIEDAGDGRTDERFLPVVVGSDVFACTPIGAVRVDGRTGEVIWKASKCGGQQAPVSVGDYLAIAADFGEVIVLDPATGSVVARRKHFEHLLQCRTRPAIAYKNRVAQCFEYGGGLAIYGVPDGELVRFIEHKWPLWELNEIDGRLFVSTGNGILLVYDESVWGL